MKKIIITSLLLFFFAFVQGQNITYQYGEKTKTNAVYADYKHLLPGSDNGQIVVVEPDFTIIGGVKKIDVSLVDAEWKESKSIVIDNSNDYDIVGAFSSHNQIHVIMQQYEKTGYRLRHVALSNSSLKVLSDSLLMDMQYDKHVDCYVWSAISPNQGYFGVAYSLRSKAEGNFQSEAILFDGDMKRLWKKTMYHGFVDQVLVTDQGVLATASLVTKGKGTNNTFIICNVVDDSESLHGEFSVSDDIDQISLLNCDGDNVVVTALEGKKAKGLSGQKDYSGVRAFLFDVESNQIEVSNVYHFTEQDICVFDNVEMNKSKGERTADRLLLYDQVTTPQGGAVLYHKFWKEETRDMSTGMSTSAAVYSRGMLLVQVNMQGEITWTRGIMQNNKNAMVKVGVDLFYYDGKLYVITNESDKAPDAYTLTEPAVAPKKLKGANAALAIYSFSCDDGTGSKNMLARDGKHILYSSLFSFGNGKYYFYAGSTSARISTITIP